MDNLLHHFAQAVARHPERVAIVDGRGRETDFAGLQNRAQQLAARWRAKGIGKGDRVLLAMPVDADLYASLAALWSLGAVVVLPEPAMGLRGLRHAARVTGVRGFCASGFYVALKYLLPELWGATLLRVQAGAQTFAGGVPDSADIALVSFTSGTSGQPKAIPRSHGFMMAQYRAISPLLHSDRVERDLVAFPVFTLINLAMGQTSILPNWKARKLAGLPPERLRDWIVAQEATRALLPPSLCETLAQAGGAEGLHTVFTGGGPVFPDVVAALQKRHGDLRVVAVYGSTEAEPIAHIEASGITAADSAAMQSGQGLLVGRPVADIRVRIVQGEIQVAGAHVNAGYLDPAQNAENKIVEGDTIWHRTGDAGEFDARGRLWLLGRVGNAVPVDGKPLHPFAIEVAARQWAGVERCALMERNGAVLVVQGDARHLDRWQENAADFGVRTVLQVAQIPMDRRHGSKVDRGALRRILGK